MKAEMFNAEGPKSFSPEDMIEHFGDQSYHRGCGMAVVAMRCGDRESSRQLSQTCIELMRRGYHKFPEKKDA